MAQSSDSARSTRNGSAATNKSSSGTSPAPTGNSPISRFNLARLWAPRSPTEQQPGQTPKRPGFGRLLFGMLIFIVVAQVLEYLLFFLNDRFPQWRLVQDTIVSDHSFPILGGMSRFTFIYLIFIVLVYIALYRFNVFPRDPFGAKARAAQQRSANTQSAAGSGGGTRAERRHASRHAATTSTGKAPPSARQVAAQARAASPTQIASASDTEYERVKAAQRLRKRRETKR